jgi:heterodisulfide reductase subunit C
LGQEDRVLKSKSIWACLACQTCTARCPQEVDVDRLLTSARIVARQKGVEPAIKEIANFLESYMENMYLYGRIGEIPLLVTLKLKEQTFFDDFLLGIKLFTRGRLSLLDLPKGAAEYRELYNRTRENEQMK